jgi:NAD(P)-dependent dehydrogenase (short-subunit alcohol dehydrogenase family)
MELFSLKGKVALVTGGTKGIGRAIARALGEAGAAVAVASRDAERCKEAETALSADGVKAKGIPCNVSHIDTLPALVESVERALGPIDVLIGNAAVNPHYGPMTEIPESAFDKIITANVKANLWLARLVLPGMVAKGGGAIVFLSSIAALRGTDDIGTYGASKAALGAIARNLAVRWGAKGVRVNCIAPGLVKTDFARALWEDPAKAKSAGEAYPMGRLGEPEDIAGAAVFLAARAGAWITGQTIVVDGGMTIAGTGRGL